MHDAVLLPTAMEHGGLKYVCLGKAGRNGSCIPGAVMGFTSGKNRRNRHLPAFH